MEGGSTPSQKSINDGFIFLLPADAVQSPEDDIQSELHHELTLTDGGTQVVGETPHTTTEEDVLLMATETEDSTGHQAFVSPVPGLEE